MKKIYLTIAALMSWAMMSVAALAVDIIVVSHGQANDPFWSVAKNGVDKACKDMKVSCKYTAPATFDMVEMAKLIDNAVSQKPKGIVITLPDAAALGKSVKAAISAGIPVISMNSGSDDYMKLGISAHVGQTEFEAGVGGGQKMKAAGGKKALCVNHEVGNVALDRRCAGFKKGFGGSVDILGTSNDPTEIQKAVAAKLGGGYDTILTLGAGLAGEAALKALEAAGKVGKVRLGTFDMSPGMLKAAAAGKVEFLIDQQQYLQGYLPIAIFGQYMRYGTMPAGVVMTGPGFVTDKLLKNLGMSKSDIDIWELNEAFAAVVLRFMEHMGVDHSDINVNGGAIAMGHPLGATGAMILGTVMDELERTNKSTALATLCVGGGMGTATVIERV